MVKCMHGVVLTARLKCWCTFRQGDYGAINGQLVKFKGDKILRFLPKKDRVISW
jgi:hypothetical protein